MAKQYMITTFDNPFNPFEQFDLWLLFDNEKGYNSAGKIARIANITEDMTDEEIKIETERAIDTIIENDFLCIYKKISNESLNEGEMSS